MDGKGGQRLFALLFILMLAGSVLMFPVSSAGEEPPFSADEIVPAGPNLLCGDVDPGFQCFDANLVDGHFLTAIWKSVTNLLSFGGNFVDTLGKSASAWDRTSGELPITFSEKLIDSYGVSSTDFALACGGLTGDSFMDSVAYFSGGAKTIWIVMMVVIGVLVLFIGWMTSSGNMHQEVVSGTWKAELARKILEIIYGEKEGNKYITMLYVSLDDPISRKTSFFGKLSGFADMYARNATGVSGLDNKAYSGLAAKSDNSWMNDAGDASDLAIEGVYDIVRGVFKAVAYAEALMVPVLVAGAFWLFGITTLGNPCSDIIVMMIYGTFWGFFAWEMLAFTAEKSVSLLLFFLPRQVVTWLLLPFTGGPIPYLNLLVQFVVKFVGINYMVSFVKPAALPPEYSLGMLLFHTLSAGGLLVLLIIYSIGLQAGFGAISQLLGEAVGWLLRFVSKIFQRADAKLGATSGKLDKKMFDASVKVKDWAKSELNKERQITDSMQKSAAAVINAKRMDKASEVGKQTQEGAFTRVTKGLGNWWAGGKK